MENIALTESTYYILLLFIIRSMATVLCSRPSSFPAGGYTLPQGHCMER